MLLFTLLIIVIASPILGSLIYRYQGGKEVFNLDIVQFSYTFILSPIIFVWAKSFLFFLVRDELGLRLSQVEIFAIDTVFSLCAFYIFSAVAIHGLTKTFWLKRRDDPHFDIFHLSEYFHLWVTHVAIFGGGMVLMTFFSVVNVLLPLDVEPNKFQLYMTLASAVFFGAIMFVSVWNSDPNQGNFMRLMKLFFGAFFILHAILYFVIDPSFSIAYGGYWFVFTTFLTAVIASFFFEKSKRVRSLRERLLHPGWGKNINIFKKK